LVNIEDIATKVLPNYAELKFEFDGFDNSIFQNLEL